MTPDELSFSVCIKTVIVQRKVDNLINFNKGTRVKVHVNFIE